MLIRRILYLLTAALLYAGLAWKVIAGAAVPPPSAWAHPANIAIKKVSSLSSSQQESTLLPNLDCSLLTYRQVYSATMQTGCFLPTAFGMMDPDSQMVIFNDTDEAVPLLAAAANQILVPWPKALNLLVLSPIANSGHALTMYTNPLIQMNDQRNALGRLAAKQLKAPPDTVLYGPDGRLLTVNPQSLAFADTGSWLVAESANGFVRTNLASLQTLVFGQAIGASGDPARLDSVAAISDSGNIAAVHSRPAATFKLYDLSTCSSATANWQANGCQYHDYWSHVQQSIKDIISIRHVRFLNESLLSFEVTARDPVNSGTYLLAPEKQITALINYLGLGDSYTSGEGAYNYTAGTDTETNRCHLSIHAYPQLLTQDLFSPAGHSVACSGARIEDVGSRRRDYLGQQAGGKRLAELEQSRDLLEAIYLNYQPGYIPQQLFVKRYQPAVLTVSVGGNDIGFGDMLTQCVMLHVSRHLSDNTCFNTYEDRLEIKNRIDQTVPRWVMLFKQLAASAPGSRIYAVGYPSIAYDKGSCGLNVQLNKSELAFSEEVVRYLNQAIEEAASTASIAYVDISGALSGHRLCEAGSSSLAVNGLTAGRDGGIGPVRFMGSESYHPNRLGHQLIEQAILGRTQNFKAYGAQARPNREPAGLLAAPKTGRAIISKVPAAIAPQVVLPGQTFRIQAESSIGLKPATAYNIYFDGPGGTHKSTLVTDTSGALNGSISSGATPGGHTIDIIGPSQSGSTIDITQPLLVPDRVDADSDGIPNETDSCPYQRNAAVDGNHDGIDDTCDNQAGSNQPGPPTESPPLSAAQAGAAGSLVATPGAEVRRSAARVQPAALAARDKANAGSTRQRLMPAPKLSKRPLMLPLIPISAGMVAAGYLYKRTRYTVRYYQHPWYASRFS